MLSNTKPAIFRSQEVDWCYILGPVLYSGLLTILGVHTCMHHHMRAIVHATPSKGRSGSNDGINIRHLVGDSIISFESYIGLLIKDNFRNNWNMLELFGFDVVLYI